MTQFTYIDQRPFHILKDDDWLYYLILYPNCRRYRSVQCKPCEELGYLDSPKDEFLIAVLLEGIHSTAPLKTSRLSRRGHRTEYYHKDGEVHGSSMCMLRVVQHHIDNRF